MPIKHGLSHALMLIIAPIISAIVFGLIGPQIPGVIAFINKISTFVIERTGISVPVRIMSIGLVSIFVAFFVGGFLQIIGFYEKGASRRFTKFFQKKR